VGDEVAFAIIIIRRAPAACYITHTIIIGIGDGLAQRRHAAKETATGCPEDATAPRAAAEGRRGTTAGRTRGGGGKAVTGETDDCRRLNRVPFDLYARQQPYRRASVAMVTGTSARRTSVRFSLCAFPPPVRPPNVLRRSTPRGRASSRGGRPVGTEMRDRRGRSPSGCPVRGAATVRKKLISMTAVKNTPAAAAAVPRPFESPALSVLHYLTFSRRTSAVGLSHRHVTYVIRYTRIYGDVRPQLWAASVPVYRPPRICTAANTFAFNYRVSLRIQ